MFKKLRHRFANKSRRNSLRENPLSRQTRRLRLENLEPRHLLTGGLTLGTVPDQTLRAGAPLQIPLNAVDTGGHPVTFSVTSSNPAISTSLPTTNPDLVLNITHTSSGQAGDSSFNGQMTIELFQNLAPNTVAKIIGLVNQGVYTHTSFYRIVQNFVIQAGQGNTPAVNVPTIDDEFNSVLRYSSAGVVGLARQTADDTGTSEFFITQGGPQEFLDYQYDIFGRLVSDPNDLLDKIASIPVNSSSSPTSPVTITSASISNDTNDLALQISAPIGTTGTGTITVNVSDGQGGTDQQTFNVTVQADTTDPGPFLETSQTAPFLQGLAAPPTTTVNTPLSFQLPAFDLQGDPLTFYNQTGLANFGLTPTQTISPNLNVSVNSTTGAVTVTPSNGLVGVTPMFFGVSSSSASSPQNNEPNTQMVPLFINPAAPTSVTLESGSDTGFSSSDGVTSLNNSANHTLKFDVSGLMSPGATILLFDGSQQIGSATYTGTTTTTTTVVVTTDGSHTLSDGQHHITAEQILATTPYTIGNSSGSFTPTSAQSSAVNVTVDTAAPTVTNVSTPAAANSTVNVGHSLNIVITFSQAVFVTGTPRLALNDTASVKYSSGSGTTALTFVYTVAPGQNTTDLDYASTAALTLNSGTINDAAGNVAVLALPATGTDNLATKDITITSPPGVADLAVTITPSAATAMAGGSIAYTITVSNSGTVDANSVSLTDTLPASVSFGSQTQASGPSFALNHTGNAITDTIDTLAAGASATLTIVADVGVGVAGGTVIADTVAVSSSSTESNTDNNSASTNVTIVSTGVALVVDPFDSTKMELVADGTAGNDNISFLPAAGGKVSVNMNGKMFGPFAVTSRIVAMGQAGNDVITVSPSIQLPAFLYAGAGIDKLSGGGGNNVLVGGGGADTLIGGTTRNVMIAGSGRSTLYSSKLGVPVGSNSGSILIAGSTDFDHNDSALSAIMHEWGSSDPYATRISKIRTGVVAPGVALNSSTIHPTAHVVDQLYASPGGYDWFLNFGLTSQMLGIDPHKKSLIQIN
jgi:uncharacterized repeat protein (TIGR01451 family)